MLLRAEAVHFTDVMADEVLLVEHGVVGAQEVVTLTEEAVVVDLRKREIRVVLSLFHPSHLPFPKTKKIICVILRACVLRFTIQKNG